MRSDNAGRYICIATNAVGHTRDYVILNVRGKLSTNSLLIFFQCFKLKKHTIPKLSNLRYSITINFPILVATVYSLKFLIYLHICIL